MLAPAIIKTKCEETVWCVCVWQLATVRMAANAGEWLGKYFRRTQLTSKGYTHFNDNHIQATCACNLQRRIIRVVRTFAMQFPISQLNRNFISLNDSGIFRNVLILILSGRTASPLPPRPLNVHRALWLHLLT